MFRTVQGAKVNLLKYVLVGVGRADCTGPTAEITLMGYAKLDQKGCGLHLRQFARAFIFDDGANRVLFVSIDACMVGFSLKNAVLEKLEELYNDTYTHENFILSGTHTHGAPGGFLVDVLYDITELGFCKETFDAYTNGIFNAIKQAHEHVTESHVYFSKGEVDANINRSPASYDLNPEAERKQYEYNTDKTLTQLKIVRASDGVLLGAINWYAVHAVSLNNTNCLVTSDNVGYASVLLESEYNPGKLVGQGDFVGAFASSNLGDVSPNMFGPICVNTGEPCDYQTSTCDGEAKYCIAMGPGENMFESAEIIATRLFTKSKDLLINDNTARELTGSVKFIHQWVEMPKQITDVQLENGTTHTVSGNPRNNPMQDATFLTVELQGVDGAWNIIATDANFETRFIWKKTSVLMGTSEAEIQWDVRENIQPGVYRIRHFGYYKLILGGIFPYEGTSNSFSVVSP
ncbi:hypothetical protein GWI33_000693 [Rhynchophorus ferrugineus]|uniref:Neutral ceramidase n=1 Tax=Rhynchophorus ferrugineus TaxID=354439 RepID=A0A834IPA6_RHYFE|nr:hypothetical protein GWI33_000693 [Rhynchophorus ferrugineus]